MVICIPGSTSGLNTARSAGYTQDSAGMAHLVYITPGGTVRQCAAATQRTSGATGTAEGADLLGFDVVVAPPT